MCRLARQLILTFTLPALCSGYLFTAAANFLFLSCPRGIEGHVVPGADFAVYDLRKSIANLLSA